MSSFADISFRSQVVFSILVKRIYLKYAHHKVLIQVPGKFGTANTHYIEQAVNSNMNPTYIFIIFLKTTIMIYQLCNKNK